MFSINRSCNKMRPSRPIVPGSVFSTIEDHMSFILEQSIGQRDVRSDLFTEAYAVDYDRFHNFIELADVFVAMS